jgi:hypothetical protein
MGFVRDVVGDKYSALHLAVDLHRQSYSSHSNYADADDAVIATANKFFSFFGGLAVVTLIIGPILDQATGRPTGNTTKGSPVQLHDDEKVTFTVAESDAKGANVADDATTTADDVSWTVDNADAVSLTVSEDTRSCELVAGTVGSAVLTVTAGSLTATVAVDVIPAGAVALTVTAGDVSKQ